MHRGWEGRAANIQANILRRFWAAPATSRCVRDIDCRATRAESREGWEPRGQGAVMAEGRNRRKPQSMAEREKERKRERGNERKWERASERKGVSARERAEQSREGESAIDRKRLKE